MQYNRFSQSLLRNREKIIYILLMNMLSLWLLTISTTHIDKFPPDTLYYVNQLPIYYWGGIILACITLIFLLYNPKLNSKKHESIQNISFIIILILYLFGLPSFIYTAPRQLDTYKVKNMINLMIDVGSKQIEQSYGRSFGMYLTEFQGSTIFFSMLIQSIGIETSLFSKYYTLYSMFMISTLIYIISRKASKKYYLFAPITYLSLAWTQGYHLSPQSYALILSIVLLYLFIILMTYARTELLIIIVWFAIVISHAFTPIINLVTFFQLFFSYIFIKYSSLLRARIRIESLSYLLIIFSSIYITYIVYESNLIIVRINSIINVLINNILYGKTFIFTDRAISNPMQSYVFAYNIRMIVIICTLLLGVLSIFYLLLNGKDVSKIFIISSFFLGYSLLGVLLVISGYNFYGADRSYVFLLVPFSILCSMVLCTRARYKKIAPKVFIVFKTSLVLFVIISMFFQPITKYASEPYEFISESEYAGKEFILNHPSLSSSYPSLTFSNLRYNWWVLKQQNGDEYINFFNSTDINRVYNSGQFLIHQNIEP